MESITSALVIVKREAVRHEAESVRNDRTPSQRERHARFGSEMRQVEAELFNAAQRVAHLESENASLVAANADRDPTASATDDDDGGSQPRGAGLTPDDLEGLPPEVLAELNISPADKFESFIVSTIRAAGGVASLDKLIVACYRERKEVHKRALLNAKLYRMTRKGLIWGVPKKKALYTTDSAIGQGDKLIDA